MSKRLVWRISERVPRGEWVDLDARPEALDLSAAELPEVITKGGWLVSSYDLLSGTDVRELEDTVPGDLLDEIFAPAARAPKKPNW